MGNKLEKASMAQSYTPSPKIKTQITTNMPGTYQVPDKYLLTNVKEKNNGKEEFIHIRAQ